MEFEGLRGQGLQSLSGLKGVYGLQGYRASNLRFRIWGVKL